MTGCWCCRETDPMIGLYVILLAAAQGPVDVWMRPPEVRVQVVSSTLTRTLLDVDVADPGVPVPAGENPLWPLGFVAVDHRGTVSVTGAPEGGAVVGEPIIWRELRVVPLWVRPGVLRAGTASLMLTCHGDAGPNPKLRPARVVGPAFRALYQQYVLNYDWVELPPATPREDGAVYLAMCPNYLLSQAQTLARWHHEAGLQAKVVTLGQIGGTTYQHVKNYLQYAYDNWDPAPEFVQIVGDITGNTSQDFPAIVLPDLVEPANYHSDHWYSLLEGTDYFADVFIARLPAQSTTVATYMVDKILDHQRDPYVETLMSPWQRKATMVSGSYGPWPSIDATKRFNAQKLLEAGYEQVDTLFTSHGATASQIVQAVNQGRSFVNYRGYYCGTDGWGTIGFYSSSVSQYIHNGRKLPVVFSVSCYSGDFAMHHCFGEYWLDVYEAGYAPRGAAGFFGSAGWTHTRHNNWLDRGLFLQLLFLPFADQFGPLQDAAKMYMHGYCGPSDTTENTFREYCILGDVAMPLWTDLPAPMVVTHADSIALGTTQLAVSVRDTLGNPINGALVCLLKEDADPLEVYLTAETQPAGGGQVVFTVTPQVTGTMLVTATAHNRLPWQDTVAVVEGDVRPPMPPAWLTVEAVGPGQALLSWEPVTQDVDGNPEKLRQYEVSRSDRAYFEPAVTSPLAIVAADTTQYLDGTSGAGSPTINSFYAVTAVDSSWNRSTASRAAGEFDFGTSDAGSSVSTR
jgi:hypothetical protein